MEKGVVEQNPASLADVEYFPVVGELLVAESPAEDILRFGGGTRMKQVKKE